MDFPLDFHLFLKICQLFPWQAGTVSGLKGPCLWPAFSFCPFLLSCYDPSQSFSLPWAAPKWPHEDTSLGFLPGLGELCLYSLWLWEVRTSAPLSHSFGNTSNIAFSSPVPPSSVTWLFSSQEYASLHPVLKETSPQGCFLDVDPSSLVAKVFS